MHTYTYMFKYYKKREGYIDLTAILSSLQLFKRHFFNVSPLHGYQLGTRFIRSDCITSYFLYAALNNVCFMFSHHRQTTFQEGGRGNNKKNQNVLTIYPMKNVATLLIL